MQKYEMHNGLDIFVSVDTFMPRASTDFCCIKKWKWNRDPA